MMQPRQRLGWRLNFAPTKGSSLSEEHTGLSAAVCINSSILLGVNEGSDISCAAAWNILIRFISKAIFEYVMLCCGTEGYENITASLLHCSVRVDICDNCSHVTSSCFKKSGLTPC
jgi:hypothetical protein